MLMFGSRGDPVVHFSVDYAGENFVRFSGDTQKHAVAQLFAWEAYEKGVDVHLLAEPTKLEMLQKEYDKKKDQFKGQVQDSILKCYGGEEHLQAPSKSLLLAQTEDYVEYSRYGKVIKVRTEPFSTSLFTYLNLFFP
jgi:pre-mRNA-processing factor SLU7